MLHQRLRAERGTVIVFVAGVMVALMSAAAYTIDLGTARQSEQRAQVAADAAALAAADDASVDADREAADATTMAQLNDPGANVAFSGANERAQVSVSGQSHNDFASVDHATSTPVSASAIADSVGSENRGAIFASDNSCSSSSPPIDIETNGDGSSPSDPSFIDGSIDSNGAVKITGNNDLWLYNGASTTAANGTTIPAFNDAVSYGANCSAPDLSGNSSSKTMAVQPMARSTPIATPPVNYLNQPYNLSTGCKTGASGSWTGGQTTQNGTTYWAGSGNTCAGGGCTGYWVGNVNFNGQGGNFASQYSGVYCIDGQATFTNYSNFAADVTIIAKGITLSNITSITGSPLYNNDLFFDCTSPPTTDATNPPPNVPGANSVTYTQNVYAAPSGGYACSMSAKNFSSGTIFAPYNTLTISATDDFDLHGYLEAQDVQITANKGLEITGNGPAVRGSTALTN